MQSTLVVVRAFGGHAIGELITVASKVIEILASEHASYVVPLAPPVSAPTENAQPEA